MTLDPFYDLRARIVDRLAVDIIGPESEEEILEDPPITRYAAGILYPSRSGFISPDQHVDEADGYDEVATPDPAVSLASTRYPSSMGLTFAVDATVEEVLVTVDAARYEPEEDDGEGRWEGDEFVASTQPSRARRVRRSVWRRVPLGPSTTTLDISRPQPGKGVEIFEGLELFHRVRPARGGAIPVTLALVNRLTSPAGDRDQYAFFQPSITVGAVEEDAAVFVERHNDDSWSGDEDIKANRLLYRHAKTYAVGHGCSVKWDPSTGSERARTVATTYQPKFDLWLVDSNPEIFSPAFDMARLAAATDAAQVEGDLREFVAEYRKWIDSQRNDVDDLPSDLRTTALDNLAKCRQSADRMDAGIDLLSNDRNVWDAFVLANSAMLEQRARSDWIGDGKPPAGPRHQGHAWRPFQLAFILQCLTGIARPDSEDREITDLLWFPTGGGKTEAYLGLIAFTIFHRRLIAPNGNGAGVTALMRYTLRLLTIQQFERASVLIAACEYLRRTRNAEYDGRLGDDENEISIGLWVGKAASPNSRADAEKALDKLRNGARLNEGNPIQLHTCPWCGIKLGSTHYYLNGDRTRLVIDCKNRSCDFFRGLPVYVIDEDLYDHRPSLIIATVDKFASLPWRERAADLFNLDHADPPPQLIIQDELHLISGPLGTMTGLYETAVELLCTDKGRRPKIIASTATIRRAETQTLGLFGRRSLTQFPPPALDARDSFFAVEAAPADKGSRLYVGLMAPGTSHTTLLVRAYASLLQSVTEFPASDEVKDPYWTLVGFFNSLRILGGARMQVSDDVADRIELLAAAKGVEPRDHRKRVELTSRESSADIPERLNEMAITYPSEEVIDVLLATNMISVGVDIERLGLMVVMGQPPSTSEYIQATSRVGRKYPGLVVTLFNASRSRDRSHYESFMGYHSALYRQVEATSVTPYSPRARDRGLHAVIVALARMMIPEFRPQGGAAAILTSRHKLGIVRQVIEDRVKVTNPEAVDGTLREFDELLDEWEVMARNHEGLVYQDTNHPDRALLVSAGSERAPDTDAWDTLWSLRDVDQTSNLYIVR